MWVFLLLNMSFKKFINIIFREASKLFFWFHFIVIFTSLEQMKFEEYTLS